MTCRWSGYGEDYDFWVEARAATRADDFDAWIRHWFLEVEDQAEYLDRLGADRVARLRAKGRADSWRDDEAAYPPDLDAPPNRWELAATWGARHLADRVLALDADAVLAGAGVANLSAWLGGRQGARAGERRAAHGRDRALGLRPVDRRPVRAQPPQLPAVDDARTTRRRCSGRSSAAPGTTTLACLGGAQVDRFGNVNSTLIPDGPFLVGSGGGNDVASVCAEAIVVALLSPERTPPECGYITSPGRAVRALVTDLGTFVKPTPDDELVLVAVPAGPEPLDDRIEAARAACGWDVAGRRRRRELAPPEPQTRSRSSGAGTRAAGSCGRADRSIDRHPLSALHRTFSRAPPGTGPSVRRAMSGVVLDRVTKRFGDVVAVDDLSLDVEDEEFLVLLGPSGCGKSTALRMIAGLEDITAGEIRIGDRVVNDVEPKNRDVAMVFQSYALYPHMTVRRNIEFPLKSRNVDEGRASGAGRTRRRQSLGLGDLLDRKPGAALGWATPTGRARAGDRAPAARLPHGRAAVEPRRQAAGADAGRARRAPAPARGDDHLRHARPGRGDDDGRSHRDPQRGRLQQVGATAGRLRRAGEPVRRPVHRQPADEHGAGERGHERRAPRRRAPGMRRARSRRRSPRRSSERIRSR